MQMGLECEIPHITAATASLVNWCRVEIHDDGSVRNDNYTIDGVAVLPMHRHEHLVYPSGAVVTDRFGAEIVTKPYDYHELHQHAATLASLFGHVPTTPRASIHVHVDVIDRPWTYVQNLVRWFLVLEAPLFRISALGEQHRGVQWFSDPQHRERGRYQQDHNYARPLTNSVGVAHGRRRVPLIDAAGLLSATTASDFVAAWGRMDLYWGELQRYCPHRLHALNLVPLLTHHTVEWRLFNGRYRYLPKVLEVIRAMHVLAERPVPYDFIAMPLGSQPSWTADEMSELLQMDVRDVWGHGWVPGCRVTAASHHYRGDLPMPSRDELSVRRIWNNAGQDDDGSASFCFGVSSATRGIQRGNRRNRLDELLDLPDEDEEEE